MAGDWLKFDKALPDKPEVFAIAADLGLDVDTVVGKLMRVWSWFDSHTVDGNARNVTAAQLDRIAGHAGFMSAMARVQWADVDPGGISLPNFDRQNGETAKKRALTAKRVAKHKGKGNATGNAAGNAPSVSETLPREENSREDSFSIEATDTDARAQAPTVRAGVFEGHSRSLTGHRPITPYAEAAIALTRAGLQVTSQNPDLIAAIDEGVQVSHLLELLASYPGKPIKYLITTARRERSERAKPITPGTTTTHATVSRQATAIAGLLRTGHSISEDEEDDHPRLVCADDQ